MVADGSYRMTDATHYSTPGRWQVACYDLEEFAANIACAHGSDDVAKGHDDYMWGSVRTGRAFQGELVSTATPPPLNQSPANLHPDLLWPSTIDQPLLLRDDHGN